MISIPLGVVVACLNGSLRRAIPNLQFERMEWNPSFDVTETKDAYVFKADVPGVKKEDLEITTTGNRVQISNRVQILVCMIKRPSSPHRALGSAWA